MRHHRKSPRLSQGFPELRGSFTECIRQRHEPGNTLATFAPICRHEENISERAVTLREIAEVRAVVFLTRATGNRKKRKGRYPWYGQMGHWEHFAHGSDIGVRGCGASPAEAFEQAALALTAVVADLSKVVPRDQVEVRSDAPDLEILLMNWLNAVIYEMAVRRMLFSKFGVTISGCSLTGSLAGENIDPERHEIAVEAKGATVTGLRVNRRPDGNWVAECVIDV